jgi:hypothetical protein
MVMGPARIGPVNDCTANYRTVLSSERATQFRIKKSSDEEKERKNLVKCPKGGPDTKTGWKTHLRS